MAIALDFARKRLLPLQWSHASPRRTADARPRSRSGCVALAEYRLDDLAQVFGVSARNIRAYRERGLLDPPRRVGRSAYYDDYHLSQLKTINHLLRKGFNSAHIAEFFASMRQGADLADILGIQRAVLGPRAGEAVRNAAAGRSRAARSSTSIRDGDEARRLLELRPRRAGRRRGGAGRSRRWPTSWRGPSDQLLYVRAILRIFEATRESIDNLATAYVAGAGGVVHRRGSAPDYVPSPRRWAN